MQPRSVGAGPGWQVQENGEGEDDTAGEAEEEEEKEEGGAEDEEVDADGGSADEQAAADGQKRCACCLTFCAEDASYLVRVRGGFPYRPSSCAHRHSAAVAEGSLQHSRVNAPQAGRARKASQFASGVLFG